MTEEEEKIREALMRDAAAIDLAAALNRHGEASVPDEWTVPGARKALDEFRSAFPEIENLLQTTRELAELHATHEAIPDGEREIRRTLAGRIEELKRTLEVAGQTVAAAFVGAATACLALAEPLRMFSIGPRYEIVSWSLRSGGPADVVINEQPGTPVNPGFVEAEGWG